MANILDNNLESIIAKKVELVSNVVATISISIVTAACTLMDGGLKDKTIENGIVNLDTIMYYIIIAVICSFFYWGAFKLSIFLFERAWMHKHRNIDISGMWYVLQTTNSDPCYLRVGIIDKIIQEYDQYAYVAYTYNVKYSFETDSFVFDKEQATTSKERGIIYRASPRDMQGVYSADRGDQENLNGLYIATIENYNEKGKPLEIKGKFVDAEFSGNRPRSGKKILFKNKTDFDEEVKRLCRERCNDSNMKTYKSIIHNNYHVVKSNFLLIFDFFGVFCDDVATKWSQKYFFSDDKNILKKKLYVQADLGEITYEKLLEELGKLANITALQVKEEWDELIQINYDIVKIARKYKNVCYTALLTNANIPLIRGIIGKYGLSDCFDEIFISSEISIVKPDIRAFNYVLSKFRISSHQAVMIDDRIEYIKAAGNLGLQTIHFTSGTDLDNRLKNIIEEYSCDS